jgi:four helix bundle protein
MSLDPHRQLCQRTKEFALRIVRLSEALPRSMPADLIGRQLLRASTSVGANYRAVGRARSKAEFISKLNIVLEEADEAAFWLEVLGDSGVFKKERLAELLKEANELVAIFNASRQTARSK